MIVCIAGMHRSGTSMVARLLNLCGVYLGEEQDLLQSAEDNPEGYWENKHFLKINLTVLDKLNGAWDLPPRFDNKDWVHHPDFLNLIRKANELVTEMNTHEVWGWKDPRNSLTFPFWQVIMPDVKVVVCVRSPFDVQMSLAKRGYSSGRFGYNLWQDYNNSMLNSIPDENRIITHYESYFHDAPAELNRILSFLEMDVDQKTIESACESAKLSLRHNKSTVVELFQHTPKHVIKLYADLCALAGPVFQKSLQEKSEENSLDENQRQTLAKFSLTLADVEEIMTLREELMERDNRITHLNVRLVNRKNTIMRLVNILQSKVREEKSILEIQLKESKAIKIQPFNLLAFPKTVLFRIFYFFRTGIKYLLLPPKKLFFRSWYLSQRVDIKKKGMDAYAHFLVYGWKEQCTPNPFFDIDYYLGQNPDIASSGLNPLFHYLEKGWHEGRNPGPFFDVSWYLLNNPDVKTEPLQHYLEHGWIENRRPSKKFSAKDFFKAYPHFKKAGRTAFPLIRRLCILETEEIIAALLP